MLSKKNKKNGMLSKLRRDCVKQDKAKTRIQVRKMKRKNKWGRKSKE